MHNGKKPSGESSLSLKKKPFRRTSTSRPAISHLTCVARGPGSPAALGLCPGAVLEIGGFASTYAVQASDVMARIPTRRIRTIEEVIIVGTKIAAERSGRAMKIRCARLESQADTCGYRGRP